MENEQQNLVVMAKTYRSDVMRLAEYIPWLTEHAGQDIVRSYDGDGEQKTTLSFPVYDATLLRFVKEAKTTQFIHKNYVYIYSRNRLQSVQDELDLISRVTMKDFGILEGILSKYVLKGMVKASVWSEGVTSGVLLNVIAKMKELVEFWGHE